ncbi:MAG TPA: methyltransferase domain-containing protein [Myxococcaceae bacterium]|nr:methyltransferase domain-containing protein [Myxococcaceae bacterium]
MSAAFRRLGQSELLPRYIFVEGLFVRRRVLEVGAVASTSGESARFLLQRGARDVVACDDDLDAVEEAQHRLGQEHLRYRASVFEDLEPGGFDVVLVADLAPYVRAPLLLSELARRVARNGWLVGALRNPAGLALSQVMEPEQGDAPPTYGQLLDALSAHLPCVEVATQSPLLGYQLAFESAEGLQVDGSLAGQGEAAWFVVFAGAEPVRRFEPTWVQLPAEPLAFTSGKLEEAVERVRASEERGHKLKSALEKGRAELDARQAEIARLAAALESARQEGARLEAQLDTYREPAGEARRRDELVTRLKRAESELQLAQQRAHEAERKIEEAQAAAEAVELARKDALARIDALEDELRMERARREEQAARAAERLEQLGSELAEARARSQQEVQHSEAERVAAQRALESQAQIVRDTQAELAAERERLDEEARAVHAARLAAATQLAEAKGAAAAAEGRRTEAEREAVAQSARAAELESMLSEARAALDAAERERHGAAAERERLGRELERHLERERAELEAADAERLRLRRELDEHIARQREQLEAVEAERRAAARLGEQLAAAQASEATLRDELDTHLETAAGLEQQVAERDARLESLQKRLSAHEAELATLRRAVGRSAGTPQVQQIYERAAAELESVKAQLLKRSTGGAKPSLISTAPSAPATRAPNAQLAAAAVKAPLASARAHSISGAPDSGALAPGLSMAPVRGGGALTLVVDEGSSKVEEQATEVTLEEDELPKRR